MCYDDNARPPLPPGEAGPAHGHDGVLTAADGNQFAAYLAHPADHASNAQIIIYPDVRGLHQFYKELALRFAEAGVTAIAIDYFGRTAGLTPRDDSFEFMPHVQQMKIESFTQDVRAAQDELRKRNPSGQATFTVGFCMGGTLSFTTGMDTSLGFAGVIGFYAGMSRNFGGAGTILDRAAEISYPSLGLFGGADQGIPVSNVQEFDEKLNATGIEHTIIIYENAPHSFFDRKYAEFASESADAWQQVLSFINAHIPA
ncbi:MAG TPA: dienelactone hydrolase family protein [Ktedonobacterales bacterium]|nr:dienelactone hydrolase family protein [Ktedonobacterales bacterium]